MAQRDSAPDALRGVAILFVVAIHAFGYLHIPTAGRAGWVWFAVTQATVPSFFLADGWIFATMRRASKWDAPKSGGTQTYLTCSISRLMLPWAIFSVLYLGTRLGFEATGLSAGAPVLPDGAASLPDAIWRGTAAAQLYFLPALMLVRIATTALHPLVRGRPVAALCLAIVLVAGWRLGLRPLLPVTPAESGPGIVAVVGIGFASLGWALVELEAGGIATLAIAVAVLALAKIGLSAPGPTATTAFQVAYVLAAWWLARASVGTRLHRWAAWVGRHTMEIYLLHCPWLVRITAAALLLGRIPPGVGLPLAVAITTAAALGIAQVLRRTGLAWLWGAAPRSTHADAPATRGREPRSPFQPV